MSYPSIISQPGSAKRNLEPITSALEPVIQQTLGESSGTSSADSSSGSTARTSKQIRILELASFPYTHITSFARKWSDVQWSGTCRDEGEVREVEKHWMDAQLPTPDNLNKPKTLDISVNEHWDNLRTTSSVNDGLFSGVIMLNLLHCVPPDYPEHVFRHLSPLSQHSFSLLDAERGWIAAYGAFRNDDGTYKSAADEQFDASYIRSKHTSLGLRTISSITNMAEKWGFREELRQTVAAGNMFVVWRVKPR